MAIDLETLKRQLETTQQEIEAAKAHFHRCDGVIQMLKHLIVEAETPPKSENE